jgi:hypothetical protein
LRFALQLEFLRSWDQHCKLRTDYNSIEPLAITKSLKINADISVLGDLMVCTAEPPSERHSASKAKSGNSGSSSGAHESKGSVKASGRSILRDLESPKQTVQIQAQVPAHTNAKPSAPPMQESKSYDPPADHKRQNSPQPMPAAAVSPPRQQRVSIATANPDQILKTKVKAPHNIHATAPASRRTVKKGLNQLASATQKWSEFWAARPDSKSPRQA